MLYAFGDRRRVIMIMLIVATAGVEFPKVQVISSDRKSISINRGLTEAMTMIEKFFSPKSGLRIVRRPQRLAPFLDQRCLEENSLEKRFVLVG